MRVDEYEVPELRKELSMPDFCDFKVSKTRALSSRFESTMPMCINSKSLAALSATALPLT
eukprot:CAMPEP_0172890778 /NCGR_PEP_ID=MMETSP1075-20121228/142134_1 /TAXON_ID=2916 /ORGANISM="Ceratium fusus, Strain PA161109" /LENGTH=59 /DNA_ID=CAMNT_0013745105 /DNA_START=21 /DNA_END=196 /DNA_ORIENTATION=+